MIKCHVIKGGILTENIFINNDINNFLEINKIPSSNVINIQRIFGWLYDTYEIWYREEPIKETKKEV